MTPTLPAACTTSADCCVAMDSCTATAYLVGKAEYAAMVASIAGQYDAGIGMCVHCIPPAIQVECQAGFCVGQKVNMNPSTPYQSSHCGTLVETTSDAGGLSSVSGSAVSDGGASASTWHCGN